MAGRSTQAAAALLLFGIWRAAQPQAPHGRETAQILSRITEFIDRHGNSRFLDINWVKPSDYADDNPRIQNQAGYFEHAGREIYLFTSSGFKKRSETSRQTGRSKPFKQWAVLPTPEMETTAKTRRDPEGGAKKLYHVNPEALHQE